jgi:hypothetical protein
VWFLQHPSIIIEKYFLNCFSDKYSTIKVPRLCPLFLIREILRIKCVYSIDGMILIRKTEVLNENSVPEPTALQPV